MSIKVRVSLYNESALAGVGRPFRALRLADRVDDGASATTPRGGGFHRTIRGWLPIRQPGGSGALRYGSRAVISWRHRIPRGGDIPLSPSRVPGGCRRLPEPGRRRATQRPLKAMLVRGRNPAEIAFRGRRDEHRPDNAYRRSVIQGLVVIGGRQEGISRPLKSGRSIRLDSGRAMAGSGARQGTLRGTKIGQLLRRPGSRPPPQMCVGAQETVALALRDTGQGRPP
jgi:hypothetical protein